VVVRKIAASVAVVMLLMAGTVLAYGLVASAARPDCPGEVECPLTGEQVCKDQCPLIDADRPDCPGKVECPITGELVCRDRCPLIDADRADCPGKVECPLTDELVCKDRCPVGETADVDDACRQQ
jgi:hypothetical protein